MIQFSAASYSVDEAAGSVIITVTRTQYSLAGSVDYVTNDGSSPASWRLVRSTNGSALERCDYTRAERHAAVRAGQASRTSQVLISDDSYVEGVETTQLVLITRARARCWARIHRNPADYRRRFQWRDQSTRQREVFVEQHLRDFSTGSDSAGLAF